MDQYIELKELFEASRNDENVIKMTACMKNKFLFYDLSNLLEKYWKIILEITNFLSTKQ